MSLGDKSVLLIVVGGLLLHITIWVIGYFTNRLAVLISFLNLAMAISFLAYWIINEMQVQQHFFEFREVAFLFFAIIIAGSALYKILSAGQLKWLTILQYIFYGIDLTILIAALIFMLTFKITKLF